jgi:hypothetical protein
MTPLRGLGIWIWEWNACEGGDLTKILACCKAWGVSWIAVKCGEKTANTQVTPERIAALRAGGVECALWWYSHPSSVDAELAYLNDFVARCGAKHLIMDAEEPWEREPTDWSKGHDWRREAASYAQRLRAMVGPDVYLADAPWARPKSHGGTFPYAEFGEVMNARHPQFYWELAEVAGEPFTHFVATADLQWAERAPGETICPIGSCVDAQGTKHCPPSELAAFDDRYSARPARSIWSWQHLSDAERALLEQRQRARVAPIVSADNAPVYVAPEQADRDPQDT